MHIITHKPNLEVYLQIGSRLVSTSLSTFRVKTTIKHRYYIQHNQGCFSLWELVESPYTRLNTEIKKPIIESKRNVRNQSKHMGFTIEEGIGIQNQ
jgi:hypothetical protein